MGHNLEQLGTASLDTLAGLITFANAQDLPEGASPRNWDVDFVVGSVFTRPGLQSVYVYANSLLITDLIVYNGIGTFTYVGKDPVVNETFTLSNFSGTTGFLNGLVITVVAVNTLLKTFTAVIGTGAFESYTGLSGTATSNVGNFLGPNPPTVAVSVATSGGNAWANPAGVLGDVTYASVATGSGNSVTQTPSAAGLVNGIVGDQVPWTNSEDIISPSTYATVSLPQNIGGNASTQALAYATTFAIPSDATVTGVEVTFKAFCSVFGIGSINVQLYNSNLQASGPGGSIGTAKNVPIGTSAAPYTVGSPTYQWGTTLTPTKVNGTEFGVTVQASTLVSNNTFVHTANFSLNSVVATVYYTLAGTTQQLKTTVYNFAVPATAGISGIGLSFKAYSTVSPTVLSFQLLKNGVAVGNVENQTLTLVPTVYTVGADNDQFGIAWSYADINNTQWGVSITAAGNGESFINDLDALIYITPALVNFNYIKSYIQDNGQTYTLALDASGLMWIENVTSDPGVLTLSLSGILPGSFAKSVTADDNEYIMFSDLSVGTDRPRVVHPNTVTGALEYLPLSQVGPGAPPLATASQGAAGTNVLYVLTYSITSLVATWTYNPATFTATVDTIWVPQNITGTEATYLNGNGLVITGTPAPGTFTTDVPAGTPNGSGTGPGINEKGAPTLTIAQGYTVHDILQSSADGKTEYGSTPFDGQEALLSAGPSSTSPGSVVTYWYNPGGPQDTSLLAAIATGLPVYVYLSPDTPFLGGQTVLVVHADTSVPPYQGGIGNIPYFTVAWTGAPAAQAQSNPQVPGLAPSPGGTPGNGNDGNFQVTMSSLSMSVAAPLAVNDVIQISGATPTDWNGTYTILQDLNSGVLDITGETVTTQGQATYSYNPSTPPFTPMAGQTVSVTGATGAPYLNGTFVVGSVGSGTFTVTIPAATPPIAATEPIGVPAVGTFFGTKFIIDPGTKAAGAGTTAVSINGDYTMDSGTLVVAGSPFTGVGAGTRQVACFFITETGYYTAASPTFTFDISGNSTYVAITHLPIGPPNVIARGIAFTEAGANGVPGANFYFIPNEVTQTINGAVTVLANSTVVHDNTTSGVNLVFTDAVLLNSEAIDIQGNDLFNLIELGSAAWVVPYASRNFYGLSLNKVTNFNNLSFDGGYLSNNTAGAPSYSTNLVGGSYPNLQPCGWTIVNSAQQTLLVSPVTGDGLYIKNTGGGPPNNLGIIYQSAYQDYLGVPIIEINTTYSVRVAASIPSGVTTGELVIQLLDYNPVTGFGGVTAYGSCIFPFSSMSTTMQVFSTTMLETPFPRAGSSFIGVSPNMVLRVYAQNMGIGADVLIDRIEVFPTQTPYLKAQVLGSYDDDPEAIDFSDNGGIVDTTTENPQACYGGFVMHDLLYLLKQSSWYSTEQNPNSEPGGWGLKEVSNKVGACGINAYDVGEEWAMTACRAGIFGFNGQIPVKLTLEIFNLWDCINWNAANTVVLRNDITNKRFYCWVPLPTGTSPTGVPTATVQWLPYAPYNPTPTSPNVCLMCNYQGLDTAAELFAGPGVHTTMFGALAAVDMKRKWTIWQIPSPYADFIYRPDGVDNPLFICNGIDSAKIYQLETLQLSDDGVAINSLYTTYGFVNAVKAATLPIFGMHTKRYTVFQVTAEGAGEMGVRFLPNVINPRYPYSIPIGISLNSPAMDDYFRSINVKGNRMFVEYSTDAVGAWMNVSKMLLTGKADPWSSLNPTGGGSAGIVG